MFETIPALSCEKSLKYSMLLAAGFALLASLTRRSWEFVLIAPFFSIFSGLTQTNSTGLVSTSADAEIQGRVLGMNSSVQALSLAVPPILSGLIAAAAVPEAPLRVAAGPMAIAGIVFLIFFRTIPTGKQKQTESLY
jgi:MFS family permease